MKFINVVLCLSSVALCSASSFAAADAATNATVVVEYVEPSASSTSSFVQPVRPATGLDYYRIPNAYPDLCKLPFADIKADLEAQIAKLTEWLTYCENSDAEAVFELFGDNTESGNALDYIIRGDENLRRYIAATISRGVKLRELSDIVRYVFALDEFKQFLLSTLSLQIEKLKKIKVQYAALGRDLMDLGSYLNSKRITFDAVEEL